MIPSIPDIPPPTGRGKAAMLWLETHGFTARIPPTASSDYGLGLTDPFLYYLTRRLGLCRALSWSKALTRGSWLHKAFELDDFTNPNPMQKEMEELYFEALEERLAELTTTCGAHGIVGEGRRRILDAEKQDAKTALSWYRTAASVMISPDYGTYREFLSPSRRNPMRLLAREFTFSTCEPGGSNRVGRFDGLLHQEQHNTLWILDLKSCSEDPRVRLASCPLEFQTQHYTSSLNYILNTSSYMQDTFGLPKGVKVGGMIHLGIRKPKIIMGPRDRSYKLVERMLLRGPRKGQTVEEREYYGEPTLENFQQRCNDWFHGRGQYVHLAKEREALPPVNLSFTPIDSIDWVEYTNRLSFVQSLATREPVPENFLRNPGNINPYGKKSIWAGLYLLPVHQWPEYIREQKLMVSHRYNEVPDGTDDLLDSPDSPEEAEAEGAEAAEADPA